MLNTTVRALRQTLTKNEHLLTKEVFSRSTVCTSSACLSNHSQSLWKNQNSQRKFLGAPTYFKTLTRNISASFIQDDGFLVLTYQNQDYKLPYIWLRDNCRCEVCYNHMTSQKNADSFTLTADIAPKHVDLEEDRKIHLTWPDGHKTKYDIEWLVAHSYSTVSKSKTPFYLWDKKALQGRLLPTVSYDDYRDSSEEGLKQTLSNLLKYGFSIIEGVEPSIKDTQQTVERIAFLQETVFGQMWSFTSDLQRSDTAYTNIFLGPHNDTTYLNLPTGIQVFHCLWHDGKGGDTLLVDGFKAAERFRKDHPDDFKYLTTAVVPHEYIEDEKHHLLSHGTILRVHPSSGELMYIRFNPYDMAPIDTIPPEEIPRFYSAYSKLRSYIDDPDNEFWIKLHPGMVLLINNWRVMHGRASFTGRRVMCGCYLPRDDWMNKARVYNLV